MRSLHRLNPLLPLLPLLLFLTSCSDFERAAYRTLAVTQAEYETVQRRMAEAAVHGLITEQQWNRFAVEGHRFIDAHNATVDAFELWSRARNQATAARLQALLEILPRLVRELNNLAASFESEPRASASGPSEPRPPASGGKSDGSRESVSEKTLNPNLQILNKLQTRNSNFQTISHRGIGILNLELI